MVIVHTTDYEIFTGTELPQYFPRYTDELVELVNKKLSQFAERWRRFREEMNKLLEQSPSLTRTVTHHLATADAALESLAPDLHTPISVLQSARLGIAHRWQ
jgi:cell division septum initiation protein DivIVA